MSVSGQPRRRLWLAANVSSAVGVVAAAFVAGYVLRWGCAPAGPTTAPAGAEGAGGEAPVEVWTCSMHPEVRRPGPGRCPKCNMPLVPVRPTEAGGLREFSPTEAAKALMDVATAEVERKFVEAEVRMVGKIDYDETRLAYITAWVPGRLDKLYVDYTGVPVKKGDHMVYIYSPELLSAQEELIQAMESVKALKNSDVGIVRETAEATVTAAREKLRLLGLKPEQIAQIEKTGKASDHLTIYSPAGGIVVHKNAQEGMYVNTGTRIYTIADLSQVWVKLDAYESDLIWLRYGQKVEFTTVSYPGETFAGTIAFIDPILTPGTRTVKLRVNAPNAAGKLKPGMFVKAVVRARVAAAGKVMEPDLAGKWMCPMHPDVLKPEAGTCDICKMPLVRTESLGYVSADPDKAEKPLVIPASAVLKTGTRAVVYVEKQGTGKPTYEGREVVLGPRAGGYYLVRKGLAEGERVVVRGNFKIDSALQILAKPSMMMPQVGRLPGETGERALHLPSLFRHQVGQVLAVAERADRAAREGRTTDAIRAAFADLERTLQAVDADKLPGAAALLWKEYAMRLGNDAAEGKTAETPGDVARVATSLRRNVRAARTGLGLEPPEPPTRPAVPAAFLRQLGPLYAGYFEMHRALAADQAEAAAAAAGKALAALGQVDAGLLAGEGQSAWTKQADSARKALAMVGGAKDIEAARRGFALLSEAMVALARRFGPPGGRAAYAMKCPMAFSNRGAVWLQEQRELRNPYFGAVMLRCGEVTDVMEAPATAPGTAARHGHEHPG